jgi:1-deoxy-D-xylulose-5-phosphate reductoisomerase
VSRALPNEGQHPLRVALLGSSGSIGRQSVDVLGSAEPGAYEIVALATGWDARTLSEQARRFRPRVVAMAEASALASLELPPATARVSGPEALTELVVRPDVDLVIVATAGIVSLRPVLAALAAGKVVAIANKETLVSAGHLVMPLARARATEKAAHATGAPLASPLAWLRPIDSEHSAIWQCLVGEDPGTVERLILTASGGPFRTWSADRLAQARPEDALRHPNWSMGAKITIDSATLMNKGLEVIEAHWLYDVPYERVTVVVHPQSLVHSLVEFVDGSVKAQLGLPDMRIPIQYAITYPQRTAGPAPRLDLVTQSAFEFERPDEERFPALRIARHAGQAGPGATAVLIAADDVAVERFRTGRLAYQGMARLVEGALERFSVSHAPELDELEALDAEVRAWAAAAPVES